MSGLHTSKDAAQEAYKQAIAIELSKEAAEYVAADELSRERAIAKVLDIHNQRQDAKSSRQVVEDGEGVFESYLDSSLNPRATPLGKEAQVYKISCELLPAIENALGI